MAHPILQVENLCHRYSRNWAIKNISFGISQTGILGLLGSNGAGKSTTMNIMCGVLNQTSGTVLIDGIDLREDPLEAKRQIGFLPQNPPLYFDLTVDEYLTHCAILRSIAPAAVRSAVTAAKERCGVGHFSKRLIKNLSGGYRQRVGIAQAIIHRPKLVVLDEPTNGLDPNQIIEVRNLIREIASDRAVIFSTHILSEVQLLCQHIKMIEKGELVFSDTMDAFNNYMSPNSILLKLGNPPSNEVFAGMEGVRKTEQLTPELFRLYYDGRPHFTELVAELSMNRGWRLQEISLEKRSLDEVFAQLSNKN